MNKKEPGKFTLSDEAINEHLTFLQNSNSAIIGKTCHMLSALGITMYPRDGLAYLIRLVNTMRKHGPFKKKLSEGDLIVDSIDKILPKIINDKEWVFDIQDFIKEKMKNILTTNKRREQRERPLYVETDIREEGERQIGYHSKVTNQIYRDYLDNPEDNEYLKKDLKHLINSANLTQRQQSIVSYMIAEYTQEEIAEELGISRSTLIRDLGEARKKLAPLFGTTST